MLLECVRVSVSDLVFERISTSIAEPLPGFGGGAESKLTQNDEKHSPNGPFLAQILRKGSGRQPSAATVASVTRQVTPEQARKSGAHWQHSLIFSGLAAVRQGSLLANGAHDGG